MLTIQYLEYSPGLARLDLSALVDRLRIAAKILPISQLLIGWHLPNNLLEACRLEADRLGLRFLRWQPLLTSDQGMRIDPSWYTEGLAGGKVPGFQEAAEFTFLCPNHPAVQEALVTHLASMLDEGLYQGFFLDRVRYPSPALDPISHLACFCEHCGRKAAEAGLDLAGVRKAILQMAAAEEGRIQLVKMLLTRRADDGESHPNPALDQFLAFREKSITEFLALIVQHLREASMEFGLDCFSPSLAPMVGQDLRRLSGLVDWIKLMSYAHTYAPAGLPYEISGLLNYLIHQTHLDEAHALTLIGNCLGLPVPEDQQTLEKVGFSSEALRKEINHGVRSGSLPILAGIELVNLPGVTHLHTAQIQADLAAIKQAKPSGLALSWDLLYIPLEWLELVRKVYIEAA